MQRRLLPVFLCIFLLSVTFTTIVTSYPIENPKDTTPGLLDEKQNYGKDLSQEIYFQVSEESYRNFVKKLTENGSRWTSEDAEGVTFSDANQKARNWIVEQLIEVSNGRIIPEVLGEYKSILGRLPGWLINDDAPVLMVGGHYDSVKDAPGANDDASGIAAVLELARVMSQYEWPLDIYFCAWNSEEIGLRGSFETTEILRQRDIEVLQYFNVDMLLTEDTNAPPDERALAVYNIHANFHESRYFAELMKMMSHNLGLDLIKVVKSSQFFGWLLSDHASFLERGYPNVVFAFESGFDDDVYYHTSDDRWDNPAYNYTLATDVVASIAASMAFVMSYAFDKPFSLSFTNLLASGEYAEYYIPISIKTLVNATVNWTDGLLRFDLVDPAGEIIGSGGTVGASGVNAQVLTANATWKGLHKVRVTNVGSKTVSFSLTIKFDGDVNGDGILDSRQWWFGGLWSQRDLDNDGLSDAVEMLIGTSRLNKDTDSDGMPDGYEYFHGLNPLVDDSQEDPDTDGVPNIFEYLNSTSPHNNDTDSDQMPDGWEIANGLDPLTNDASEDPDEDGATNLEEFERGTNPHIADYPEHSPPLHLDTTLVVIGGVVGLVIVVGLWRWKMK